MKIRSKIAFVALCTVPALAVMGVLPSREAEAAGECAKLTNVREQLICVEKKIDGLKIPQLPAQFRLQSVSRHQCIKWVDNNTPPFTLSCDHDDQLWRIVPQ